MHFSIVTMIVTDATETKLHATPPEASASEFCRQCFYLATSLAGEYGVH